MYAARNGEALATGESERIPAPPPFGVVLEPIHVEEIRPSRSPRLTAPVDDAPPDDAQALADALERGLEALLRKDHEAALRAYRRAHQLSPDDKSVAVNIQRLDEIIERNRT